MHIKTRRSAQKSKFVSWPEVTPKPEQAEYYNNLLTINWLIEKFQKKSLKDAG